MPTLYERLISPGEGNVKIPIHGFKELLHEFNRGNITAQDLVNAFNLDAGQQAEATTIYQKSNIVANKADYFTRLFGWLAIAEIGLLPSQYNEANFWAWINGIS